MKFHYGDMELEVPEGIYYPEEDSFLLADVLEGLELRGKNVLDMGCGSGFLSLLCASKGASVTATDITEDAVETTKSNASVNNIRISAFVSDMFDKINGKYDFIIFNLPYLPKDGEAEHVTYTGGFEIAERFIKQCGKYLVPGGGALILISSFTGKENVIECLNENGFSAKIAAKEKVDWEELMVIEASTDKNTPD